MASHVARGGWKSEASNALALFGESFVVDVGELPASLTELMASLRDAPGEGGGPQAGRDSGPDRP